VVRIYRLFQGLILVGFLLGSSARPLDALAFGGGEPSVLAAQPEIGDVDWRNHQEIPDYFELVAENDNFQLYVDQSTIAFKVLDKRSGYIWSSNLDEVTKDDKLNKTWTAFARSGISIDYLDQKAISERLSITNSENTLNVNLTEDGFQASVKFIDPSISLVVMVTLEPDGVRVEVPFESIKEEDPDFKLGLLYVYPFFAATKEDSVPGYMFIPDGCGSLVRFGATTKATNILYARYYGSDLGMLASIPYNPMVNRPYNFSIPVIGMVHGHKQNAYISVIEEGASYAQVQMHPAGVITRFNFLFNAFIYNESYFQATNRSGAGVITLQPSTNAYDVKIHYRFLTGDDSDYVGMAKSYQKYLVDKGILQRSADEDGDIGIRLEFLGGEKEKVLIWQRLIPMTTVDQMAGILENLDVKDPEVIYYGWQPLGASSMPPKSLKLDSGLGTVHQLASLADSIVASGGNFYLYLDPQAALMGEKGYSPRYDLAMSITNFNLTGYNNRNEENYYFNFDAVSERYSALSEDVFSELNAGLALDGIGSMLFSDFKSKNVLNRENAIISYQQMLAEDDGITSFYLPNDYMFGYVNAYYDIPLTNNGYVYTTDVVPFLQIVLSGYVPVYGTALNFSSNITDELLRHVDFGVYPSYFLTYDVTAKILNTRSNWIYTSSYAQWGDEIERTYKWLDNLLGPVEGQAIIARKVIVEGVVATTYANGKQIIVNYTNRPFSAGVISVNAKDAVIREVVP